MVLNKEGACHIFLDLHVLNKIIIKDKFPVLVIDELLDELHGAMFFTKLVLHFGYRQMWKKELDIPKVAFHTHEGHYDFFHDSLCSLQFSIHLLDPYNDQDF